MPAAGELSFIMEDGAARRIAYHGVEVLRRIDYPIRDADWRTFAVEEIEAERRESPPLRYRREFRTTDGAFRGSFEIEAADEGRRRGYRRRWS
jgi:hypothetical protein